MLISGYIFLQSVTDPARTHQLEGRLLGLEEGADTDGGIYKLGDTIDGDSVEIEVRSGPLGRTITKVSVISDQWEYANDDLTFDWHNDLFTDDEWDDIEGPSEEDDL